MKPGLLKQRITLLNPPGLDENDNPKTEWTEHVTVWAELKTLKGRAFYYAAQTNMENVREFKIRYRKDLHDHMRIRWNGQIHELVAPIENDDGLNKTMTLFVKAVSS